MGDTVMKHRVWILDGFLASKADTGETSLGRLPNDHSYWEEE